MRVSAPLGNGQRVTRPARALASRSVVPILNHMVHQSSRLDEAFSALSDPTRRGILDRVARGDATISDLASEFEMTLTGVRKHVKILEEAGLLTTEKIGRVRTCRLGPRRLEDEIAWIRRYQRMLEGRLDRLGAFLERREGEAS